MSKKLMAMIGGVLINLGGILSGSLEAVTGIQLITGLIAAYFIGNGMEHIGKGK